MKKIIIYITIVSLAFLTLSSCEEMFGDYLDQAPSTELPEEEVWTNFDYVRYFHNDIYTFQRSGFDRISNSWLDAATDLAETSRPSGGVESSLNVGNYYAGSGYSETIDTWHHYYRGIRKINMFFERVNDVPLKKDETQEQRNTAVDEMANEAHYLRAFFYFELFERYGGVPIVTKTFSTDNIEEMMVSRNSIDEVVAYILNELGKASNLPKNRTASTLGRPTIGAAMALKSRLLLYYASPLYNLDNNQERWKNAMNAAKTVIDLGTYNLHADYQALFNVIISPEIIHAKYSPQGNWWPSESPVGYGGSGGLSPSQNLVDMYDMANGESPILGYNEDGSPIINPDAGYDLNHPYKNREPRFYKSILYNGCEWWQRPIETFLGGIDKPAGNTDATETSYYHRKFMDDKATHPINGGTTFRNWIYFRYAEILLNYAEARNEYMGPDEEVYTILDKLRSRNGNGITTALTRDYTKEGLRDRIKKERAVELAFEEHRWWDLKRWRDGDVLNSPILGMEIKRKSDNTFTYDYIKVEDRYFDERMYFYPIPLSEIYKNPNLENNPGWE